MSEDGPNSLEHRAKSRSKYFLSFSLVAIFSPRKMTTAITSLLPEKRDLPPKNRVVGFEGVTGSCIGDFAVQVIGMHQEITTTSTTIVSGVFEWLSNDPIGISGGVNQYVFCNDNPVNFVDPWGLKFAFGDGFTDAEKQDILNTFAKVKATAAGLALYNSINNAKELVLIVPKQAGGRAGKDRNNQLFMAIPSTVNFGVLAHEMQHSAEDTCPENNPDPAGLGVVSSGDPSYSGSSEAAENRAVRAQNIVVDQFYRNPANTGLPPIKMKPRTTYNGEWNVSEPYGTKYKPL